jgi:hypothetical protein
MRAAVSGRMPKLPRPVNHQPEVSGKFKRASRQLPSALNLRYLPTGLAWDSPLPRSQLTPRMLMRVETSFRIFGYPGFAMIFFLLAAIAGVGLAITIIMADVNARKKGDG